MASQTWRATSGSSRITILQEIAPLIAAGARPAAAAHARGKVRLGGPGGDPETLRAVVRPDVRDGFTAKQRVDEPQRLLQPEGALAHAAAELEAERAGLQFDPRRSHAQDGASATGMVQGHGQLCREARVPKRVGPDHEAEGGPGRPPRPGRQGEPALMDGRPRIAEVRQEVVERPEVVVAEVVDKPGCIAHRSPIGALAPDGHTELHGVTRRTRLRN